MVERLKVTLSGTTYDGAERFAWGVHLGGLGSEAVTAAEVQAYAVAVAARVSAITTAAWLNEASTATVYRNVNVQYYFSDGPATLSGAAPITPTKAGASTVSMPPQAARCVSLLTANAGRRYRGRFYLPSSGASINSAGKSAPPSGMATSLSQLLAGIASDWPGTADPYIGVYSQAGGFITPVITVRVGDVIDTQRRRSDALVEVFQTAPL